MMIWSGLGFLVPVIAFALLILTECVTESVLKDSNYYQAHGWPKLLALVLSGILVWILGKFFAKKPGRVVIDKASGQELELKSSHTLFFIRMEYWGPILMVIGIVFLFVKA